jgi:hypothetical protein
VNIIDYARKAMDSVTNANNERKDLSGTITLKDGPPRPFLQAIGDPIPAKGKTHYWNEVGLNAAGHGGATYAEGAKPASDTNAPAQLSNTVCRIGKCAKVTDTETAVWTGAGSYRLADGELERLIQEAIDLDTELKMEEVLNEMEWMLINGDSANAEAWAGGQCDGVSKIITTNVVAAGDITAAGTAGAGGSGFFMVKGNAALYEGYVQTLAQNIKTGYAPAVPNLFLSTTPQKNVINSFIGGGAGRPIVQVVSADSAGYVAGQEVDEYQTGFFKVRVTIQPQLELSALTGKSVVPTKTSSLMLNTKRFRRADLIKLGAEPLARINTSVERMITTEFTLEYRNQKESGKITNLLL